MNENFQVFPPRRKKSGKGSNIPLCKTYAAGFAGVYVISYKLMAKVMDE